MKIKFILISAILLILVLLFVNFFILNYPKVKITGRATGSCVVDGICDASFGEDSINCPEDCGSGGSSGGSGGGIVVSSGVIEDIPLGKAIANSTTFGFDWSFDDADIETLKDTQINFQGKDYDIHEELILSKYGPSIETSLTSQDDDYMSNIFLEAISKDVHIFYVFDDAINVSKATTNEPLTINFLGKNIKIISVGDLDQNRGNKFTAMIDCDSGLHTFMDGDAFIGENENDPDWEWIISGLAESAATALNVTQAEFRSSYPAGPVIGIQSAFTKDDDTDFPPGIGACYNLPNNYVSICLDSLTVPDNDYLEVTTKYNPSVDTAKSGNVNGLTSAKVIEITAPGSSRFNLGGHLTSQIWLQVFTNGEIGIFYDDPNQNPSVQFLNSFTFATKTDIASVEFGDTNGNNVKIGGELINLILNIFVDMVGDSSVELETGEDSLISKWLISSGEFVSLGSILSLEEPDEIIWSTLYESFTSINNLGIKNEDHRTKYGIIIKDPKSNGASDRVILLIPSDQVQGNVNVFSSTPSTLPGSCPTICTSGCPINNICVPIGYRYFTEETGSLFCGLIFTGSTVFISQMDLGGDCENNYECKSNFCSNNKCVDLVSDIQSNTGILNQILAFLQSK